MSYNVPSLERLALTKTAIMLWNQDDIRPLFLRFEFLPPPYPFRRKGEWQKLEDKATEKVSQLPIPTSLKDSVLGIIKPIGLQYIKIMTCYRARDSLNEIMNANEIISINLPNQLCWTPHGTIDEKKTAEVLIKDENLDVFTRYKLACFYCLEDDIPYLWRKIPETEKRRVYKKNVVNNKENKSLILWTYETNNKMAELNRMFEIMDYPYSPYRDACRYATFRYNKIATAYFLQKLTSSERDECLVNFTRQLMRSHVPYDYYSVNDGIIADMCVTLLSQMKEEQKVEVYQMHPCQVLHCFLEWPFQCSFMETASRMWVFLSKEDFGILLGLIIEKQIRGYKDYDYQKLFGEFWQHSPTNHKKFITARFNNSGLLSKLFLVKDKRNIRLLLEVASTREREIICSESGKFICLGLAKKGESDLLIFFLQECLPDKDMMKFREEFRKYVLLKCSKDILDSQKATWGKVFQFLDDSIQDVQKRGVEGDYGPAKKLRSCNSGKFIDYRD